MTSLVMELDKYLIGLLGVWDRRKKKTLREIVTQSCSIRQAGRKSLLGGRSGCEKKRECGAKDPTTKKERNGTLY